MRNQEKIYELSEVICKGCKTRHECDTENCIMSEVVAEYLLDNDYGKISEVAKEILQRVVNICKNEEDFQDGTVNTQLEPLYFGIANGCAYVRGEVKELAKEYGAEIDE